MSTVAAGALVSPGARVSRATICPASAVRVSRSTSSEVSDAVGSSKATTRTPGFIASIPAFHSSQESRPQA